MQPTKEQFNAFADVYTYFNDRLFNGELPNCILNFSRKKTNVGGFFAPKRWAGPNGVVVHEISLNPEGYTSEYRHVISILVHEMVHLWQQEFGKPSRSGYHNKEWGTKMEDVGLMPSNTGEPGGKRTGQQMTHYIIQSGPFDNAYKKMPAALLIPFWHVPPEPLLAKAGSRTKYTCEDCDINLWGKAGIRIECLECGKPFMEQSI